MPVIDTKQWSARDLTRVCDYIQEHASSNFARRAGLSIFERVGALAEFPECRSGTGESILTALPYLAVYRIPGDKIEILRILHGSQNWP